jgi:hypothetical protein
LRASFEARSGVSLSDVRVHRGSNEPAKFGALALARGDEVHLAEGQDAHLPHEVWHVVQQRQGRVGPTRHESGVAVNDDPALEREASRMAAGGSRVEPEGRTAPGRGDVAVIQRVVAPPGPTVRGWDPLDVKLGNIATAVDDYNLAAGTEHTTADFQASFRRLQLVERSIYRWFRTQSRGHQQLRQIPLYQQVNGLLNSAATEYEALVERTKDMPNVLPFGTAGMNRAQRQATRVLWQDIVNRRGNIQVLGSNPYQVRIRSELAKILSTPTGRRLLTYLNAPKPGLLAGSQAEALNRIYIAEQINQLPPAVVAASPELHDLNQSESQPLNIDSNAGRRIEDITEATETDIDPTNPPDPIQFPAVTSANMSRVLDIVLGGGRGYTHGTKKYEFTKPGTGSFVTSFPQMSLMGGVHQRNQILDPSWVTLGHELGHSANMKAGGTQLKQLAHVDAPLVTGLGGGAVENKKWSNAEELLNIRNVENALRGESRLSTRIGHQPPQWATTVAVQVRNALRVPLYTLRGLDWAWNDHPDWNRLEHKYRTLPALACNNPVAVQACQAERDQFLQLWTVGPFAAPTGGNAFFARWKAMKGL